MGWWSRLTSQEPLVDREAQLVELIKAAQKIVRSYSSLVGQSGPNLPESALPYPKDAIRASLLTVGLLESSPEMRSNLCVMYGTLEDFLPHDEWKILHEWKQMAGTEDMTAHANATLAAIPIQAAVAKRSIERMKEFNEKMAEQDGRRHV
jgi:hypothetical protein